MSNLWGAEKIKIGTGTTDFIPDWSSFAQTWYECPSAMDSKTGSYYACDASKYPFLHSLYIFLPRLPLTKASMITAQQGQSYQLGKAHLSWTYQIYQGWKNSTVKKRRSVYSNCLNSDILIMMNNFSFLVLCPSKISSRSIPSIQRSSDRRVYENWTFKAGSG